jgi:hypothetical protein
VDAGSVVELLEELEEWEEEGGRREEWEGSR